MEIPLTKQKNVTFWIPNISLLKGINQLKELRQHKTFGQEMWIKTCIFLIKKAKEFNRLKNTNTKFFEEIYLWDKNPTVHWRTKFLKKISKESQRRKVVKLRFLSILLNIFIGRPARNHIFWLKFYKKQILKQEA